MLFGKKNKLFILRITWNKYIPWTECRDFFNAKQVVIIKTAGHSGRAD
jgi:hypothetical protein